MTCRPGGKAHHDDEPIRSSISTSQWRIETVTSNAKRAANQRNSLLSTGPKTPSGKAAVSRNALRHGLAVPLASLPSGADDVEAFLAELIQPGARPEVRYYARKIAETTLELRRISELRTFMLKMAKEDLNEFLDTALGGTDVDIVDPFRYVPENMRRFARYERRTLSRRDRALRDLKQVLS
jgi:hypothetical protein